MNENELAKIVVGLCLKIHRALGPGLLESVYQHCMIRELRRRELDVKITVPVPLHYKGDPLNKDYIIDMLVENEIIVELKAIEGILKVHEAQVISYLKLAIKRPGFLQF